MSEKLTLIAGRDGGVQNMEVLGIIMLRISDPEYGRIRVLLDNKESRPIQFQVRDCYHSYIYPSMQNRVSYHPV